MRPWDFEELEWDEDDDENGNAAHCLRHGVNEQVVSEVLMEEPAEVDIGIKSAEYSVIGPDKSGRTWTLLFAHSSKRGDWLRPITGWLATPSELREWKNARGRKQ